MERKGTVHPPERLRYPDPSTEFPVTRLTSPKYTSVFPQPFCRCLSRKGDFVIFVSDRAGSAQVFRLEVKSGKSRQLTDALALHPNTVTLSPDDKSFAFFDGQTLYQSGINRLSARPLYTVPAGWQLGQGLHFSADDKFAAFTEHGTGGWRARLIELRKRKVRTVLEDTRELAVPVPRPTGSFLLYRRAGDEIWMAGFNGKRRLKLDTPPGTAGPAVWSTDGRSILYLHFPPTRRELNAIRVYYVDSGRDQRVAKTSQFVCFSPNRDASVLVGASSGKATPYVFLLLRSTGKELPLCEHKSSRPAEVNPFFSADSKRVFYQSDRDGHTAIYSVELGNLIEPTA